MIGFAQVVAVYPAVRRVDLVDMDTGRPYGNAIVLSDDCSTAGGSWNVPSVDRPSGTAADETSLPAQGAVCAYALAAGGRPVVLGMCRVYGDQIVFNQQDRQITRHAKSGAYWTTAPDGSMEMWHPSGSYFRIGTGAHEDLAPLCAGKWVVPEGTAIPTITLATPNFSAVINPDGTGVVTHKGMTYQGAPMIVDGGLKVKNGDISCTGKVAAEGDVTAGGVSLEEHDHPVNGDMTGPPQG